MVAGHHTAALNECMSRRLVGLAADFDATCR